MNQLISGIVAMGCWVMAVFFIEAWRRTSDRLFCLFGIAFVILGAERVAPVLIELPTDEARTPLYLVRLAAFAAILWGIADKNRKAKTARGK